MSVYMDKWLLTFVTNYMLQLTLGTNGTKKCLRGLLNFFFGCKYNMNDTIETLEREFQCQKWFLPTSDTLDLQEVWRFIGYSVVYPM